MSTELQNCYYEGATFQSEEWNPQVSTSTCRACLVVQCRRIQVLLNCIIETSVVRSKTFQGKLVNLHMIEITDKSIETVAGGIFQSIVTLTYDNTCKITQLTVSQIVSEQSRKPQAVRNSHRRVL